MNFSRSISDIFRNASIFSLDDREYSRNISPSSLISAAHAAARLGFNASAYNPRNSARTSVPRDIVNSRSIALASCIGSAANAAACATTPSGRTNIASVIVVLSSFARPSARVAASVIVRARSIRAIGVLRPSRASRRPFAARDARRASTRVDE